MNEDAEHRSPLSENDRDLYRIIMVSNFLAVGGLGAVLYSFRPNRDPMLEISVGTFVAFLAGGILSTLFWRWVRGISEGKRHPLNLGWNWVIPTLVLMVVIFGVLGVVNWLGPFWSGVCLAISVLSAFTILFL